MRIFWSWQSDTPGDVGRFFVRDALTAAIERLKRTDEIIEPAEREAVASMHLDQDRQGVSGSPDLARTILEKIEVASIFVADVTPVGILQPIADSAGGKTVANPKKPINSNVAIELGYALHAHTDRALLMVMNGYYGDRDDLPFDLKHKAGPIIFRLAPDADKSAIKAASQQLTAQLVDALRLCVAATAEDKRRSAQFEPVKSTSSPAVYFASGEILASAGYPGEQEFQFVGDKLAYLRLFPVHPGKPVGLASINQSFSMQKPCPMSMLIGGIYSRNKYGPIIIDFEGKSTITSLTQGFPTGELWGINNRIIRPLAEGASLEVLPMITLEKLYVRVLENYVKVAADLGLSPPYTVIAGLVGLNGIYLTAPGGPLNNGQLLGPIYDGTFERSYVLEKEESITDILRSLFIAIYDLAAITRRDVLTDALVAAHGLPPR